MSIRNLTAADLGAESGGVMLARLESRRFTIEGIHRLSIAQRVSGNIPRGCLCLWN